MLLFHLYFHCVITFIKYTNKKYKDATGHYLKSTYETEPST